jgi:ABC-2 type transport system ATP-binding protein
MAGVLRGLEERGIAVADIALRKPTLDDVFLRLTGHGAEPQRARRARGARPARRGHDRLTTKETADDHRQHPGR